MKKHVSAVLVLIFISIFSGKCLGAGPFGIAKHPPMGWRSWNAYHKNINQEKMQTVMDAMVKRTRFVDGRKQSLADVGYINCGLDDAWQKCGAGVENSFHDANGMPIINTDLFPNMKAMVDYGHQKKLHVGWYINNCICAENQFRDNKTMTDKIFSGTIEALTKYGFDGVKIDSCSEFHGMARWADLLNKTGRPVLTENCHNSDGQDPCPEAKVCPKEAKCPYNFWRTSTDINPSWNSIYSNLHTTIPWLGEPSLSRPGRWAYPDMLEVGNMASYQEDRAHFGAWCIISAPLILGYDLADETVTNKVWDIVTNTKAIAVNQAWHGHPGKLVKTWTSEGDKLELWAKPLGVDSMAIFIWNLASPGGKNHTVKIDFSLLNMTGNSNVWDIWYHKDLGKQQTSFMTDAFGGHDSRFYILNGTKIKSIPMPQANCTERCFEFGHCCVGDISSYQHPSCVMGCTIAENTDSLQKCWSTCHDADNQCQYSIGGHDFNMCSNCPKGCDVGDGIGECLQACLFHFGCNAI